jgi:protease I
MADKFLSGKSVLMIIAPTQFRDEELLVPKKEFESAGANVTVASTRPGEAQGMLGAKVNVNATIYSVNPDNFAGIVIVGGMGSPEHLWGAVQLHDLIRHFHSRKQLVAAICLSGAVLAKSGVLNGKSATVWPDDKAIQELKTGKASYVKEPVVQDGHIVTADGPEAAETFARHCLEELSKVRV